MNFKLEDLQKNFKNLAYALFVELEKTNKEQKSIPESVLNKMSLRDINLSLLPKMQRYIVRFLQDTLITVTENYEELEGEIKKLADGSSEKQQLRETQNSFLYAYCAALDIVSKFGVTSTLTVEIDKFLSGGLTLADKAIAYNRFKDLALVQPEIFSNVSPVKRDEILTYAIKNGIDINAKAIDSYEEKVGDAPNMTSFVQIQKKQDDVPVSADSVTQTTDLIAKTIASALIKHAYEENIAVERRVHIKILGILKKLLENLDSEEAQVLNIHVCGILYSIALSSYSRYSVTHAELAQGLEIDKLSFLQKFEYLQFANKLIENQLLVVSPTEIYIRKDNLFSTIKEFKVKPFFKQIVNQLYDAFKEYILSKEIKKQHKAKFLELHPDDEKPTGLLSFLYSFTTTKTDNKEPEDDQNDALILS